MLSRKILLTLVCAVLASFPAVSHASPRTAEPPGPDWAAMRSALILWIQKPSKSEICSGVAIDRRMVLTAAHCLDGATRVRASYGSEPAEQPELTIMGARWSIHPKYDRSVSYFLHDLGVLELAEPLPEEVPLAELATPKELGRGVRLERVGFGRRNGMIRRTWTDPVYRGLASDLAVVSQDQNAVPGDSGGPIFVRIDGKPRLIAVHSTLQKGGRALSVSVVPNLQEWLNLRAIAPGKQSISPRNHSLTTQITQDISLSNPAGPNSPPSPGVGP